jgi:hypothetical protein
VVDDLLDFAEPVREKTLGIGDVLSTSGLNQITMPTSPFPEFHEPWTMDWALARNGNVSNNIANFPYTMRPIEARSSWNPRTTHVRHWKSSIEPPFRQQPVFKHGRSTGTYTVLHIDR